MVSRDPRDLPAADDGSDETEPAGIRLWVVVPAWNEERGIGATMSALAAQRDRDFTLVVVDNASTDATVAEVERACAASTLDVQVITEPRKGTGAAADTGVRHAIAHGATHVLRTDADTLPAPGWTAAARRAFAGGADLVTGPMRARSDEVRLKVWERAVLPAVIGVCQTFGRLRPSNRSPELHGPYRMSPGCNLGVSARAYVASGGFPRTAIEEVHEDRELVNRVRRVSGRVELHRDLVVHASVRRLRAYGLLGTLRWYLDHGHHPDVVDVRGLA
ncbi:glycosyltransferase involved in cell wall biosynthesis [Humibacillus xanthopallidus]|uniref:4,4'-diaponeurosporenoate glycosyltransferase n=1 Tax=Humibacillus xanthopallidus TaxID=412689 RepID=A0A543HWD3_9MICO|nr:glycosyltransferase involved in cell wall biosynthesis [Humibacillus xanthopallidus]